MPALSIDLDAEPWSLDATLPLERALGIPVDDDRDERSSIAYLTSPRLAPGELAQPLPLTVSGRTPAALMTRRRGFGQSAVTDLIVAPELGTLLRSARLPSHVVLAAAADVLGRPAQVPVEWIWWTLPYDRVDFANTTFEVHEKDGTVDEARFECFEDYEQVRKRSMRAHFAIIPKMVHWLDADPSCDDVDLQLIGHDKWRISPALAEAIREAQLPGILVND